VLTVAPNGASSTNVLIKMSQSTSAAAALSEEETHTKLAF